MFKTEHLDIANSLHNLAQLYNYQRKYSEAEPLLQEALAMRKLFFSTEDPDVAVSLNDLGSLYHFSGKYSEAEPLLQEALAMRKL
ncbi:tetratricopeptide repeat protein, partial [Dapis sp. BLCC M172]|uniref:tetratricopeptide repeat protein n=1 Tax=Dapis sp. BLCC M172 TaxID=2975281 RepID=UPI003CF0B2FA